MVGAALDLSSFLYDPSGDLEYLIEVPEKITNQERFLLASHLHPALHAVAPHSAYFQKLIIVSPPPPAADGEPGGRSVNAAWHMGVTIDRWMREVQRSPGGALSSAEATKPVLLDMFALPVWGKKQQQESVAKEIVRMMRSSSL